MSKAKKALNCSRDHIYDPSIDLIASQTATSTAQIRLLVVTLEGILKIIILLPYSNAILTPPVFEP